MMNQRQLPGEWKQAAKSYWSKLTDQELENIDGNFGSLVDFLQRRYSLGIDEARSDAEQFCETCETDLASRGLNDVASKEMDAECGQGQVNEGSKGCCHAGFVGVLASLVPDGCGAAGGDSTGGGVVQGGLTAGHDKFRDVSQHLVQSSSGAQHPLDLGGGSENGGRFGSPTRLNSTAGEAQMMTRSWGDGS